MTPTALLTSWLTAAAAVPAVLLIGAAAQGLGTLVVGGGWIGVCLPWDRQAWALVNQPVLNFAALPSATGYWLGSIAGPLAVAAVAMPASLRLRSLTGQLAVVQLAFVATVVGVGWQPNLEPAANHLARWLGFRGVAPELGWLTAAAGAAITVPIVLRLIALARITRFALSRLRRMLLIVLHLFPVPIAWAALSSTTAGRLPVEACLAVAAPLAVASATAWISYPAPLTHAVTGCRGSRLATCAVVGLALWSLFAAAGRPLAGDRAAALQWAAESSLNNIRPWMAPVQAPWLDRPASISE